MWQGTEFTSYPPGMMQQGEKMKFLFKLDPMMVLMLVVIFGVVITMSTQVMKQASVSEAAAQVMPVNSANLTPVRNYPGES